jgi:hypothetical protein
MVMFEAFINTLLTPYKQQLRHASESWHPESAYRPILFKPWIPGPGFKHAGAGPRRNDDLFRGLAPK